MTTKNINSIVCCTMIKAQRLNKFKTFATIFRATFDEHFSAKMSDGYRNGMTFQDWGSYRVGDDDFGYYDESVKSRFISLAKEKGIYAETEEA